MFKVADLEKVVTEIKKRQSINVAITKTYDEHKLSFVLPDDVEIVITEDWKKGDISMYRVPTVKETKKL